MLIVFRQAQPDLPVRLPSCVCAPEITTPRRQSGDHQVQRPSTHPSNELTLTQFKQQIQHREQREHVRGPGFGPFRNRRSR